MHAHTRKHGMSRQNSRVESTDLVQHHYFEASYAQLRNYARYLLTTERKGHTLQPTALVNEAFLKLGQNRRLPWANESHFYVAATDAMRKILLDYAKYKKRYKRGGTRQRQPYNESSIPAKIAAGIDVVALDSAFQRLEQESPQAAKVVRLRFYLGMTIAETAETLELSPRTVSARWAFAKARLRDLLRD